MSKKIIGSVLAILVLLIVVSGVAAGSSPNRTCQLPQTSLPAGFGSPLSFLSSGLSVFDVFCDSSSVKVRTNDLSPTLYTWKTGYLWENDSWQPYEFDCPNKQKGSWCLGPAEMNIPQKTNISREQFVIAYTCQKDGSTWKCGCRDSVCRESFWQLRSFKSAFSTKNTEKADQSNKISSENDKSDNVSKPTDNRTDASAGGGGGGQGGGKGGYGQIGGQGGTISEPANESNSETVLTGGGAAGTSGGPYLILAPDNNNNAGILVNNREAFVNSPFDGVTVNTTAMWLMAHNGTVSYEEIMSNVGSLRGYPKMEHSFLVILVPGAGTQPDVFDDWSRTIQGWVNFARAARELGMAGVVFDNEPYVGRSPWDYPGGVKYANRYSLKQYQDQTRKRGKEVMEAMRKVFPDIKVLVYHGPYISEPSFYRSDLKAQSDLSPLNGSFTAGLLEGAGTQAMVIDGGEVYANRTEEDFRKFYNFRKYTMASDENDSPVVVPSLRKVWPERLSISNGLYNLSWSAPMSPDIMRSTIANAMKYSDDYVWLYTEEVNWMSDLPDEWAQAIREGKAAGLNSRRSR